ncbi:50S ribosomal protein L18e [Candidatus Bathyarchaeota archaeon]|nr:50S ribosomal protein L18e [Candidatus Bathyarchaeota archaeon]
MGRKVTGPQDINVRRIIRQLENTRIKVWKEVASYLKKARRKRVEANLGRINRITNDGEVIVIPGKLLGTGMIDKKITIGALSWSKGAKRKAEEAGITLLELSDIVKQNPSGANVKLVC